MDSMIRELVGIDRVAQERVETVRAWYDEQKQAIAAEKDALNATLAEKRELQLAQFSAEVQAERDVEVAALEAEHSAAVEALEAKFERHRSEWADALFSRTLQ